jgi:hypothetical protein
MTDFFLSAESDGETEDSDPYPQTRTQGNTHDKVEARCTKQGVAFCQVCHREDLDFSSGLMSNCHVNTLAKRG